MIALAENWKAVYRWVISGLCILLQSSVLSRYSSDFIRYILKKGVIYSREKLALISPKQI